MIRDRFLSLQASRTPTHREQHRAIVDTPNDAKRLFLEAAIPNSTAAQREAMIRNQRDDPAHESANLMLSGARTGAAAFLYKRKWAVYRTAGPVVTCDDPVVFVAGPPAPRSMNLGGMFSAVILYPVDPHHLLVMLRPDLSHRAPFLLDERETAQVNLEIVAAATRSAFERPGDDIAINFSVPPRASSTADDDSNDVEPTESLKVMLRDATPRTRWNGHNGSGPDWPVQRWYQR